MNRLGIFGLLCCISSAAFTQDPGSRNINRQIDQQVVKLMNEGNIPGLSLVIIEGNKETIKTYGYADLERKKPVTPATLFEIASCSKAFTALAAQKLAHEGIIDLNRYVSDFIPGFRPTYKDSLVKVTILQLLHHTSGIPWESISRIPEGDDMNALKRTVRKICNIKLRNLPGKKFEYATVNYDILAFIIEKITNQTIEHYIKANIFEALNMCSTAMGRASDSSLLSTGYKIGFFKPRAYKAPVYRGNNAAGYIISNAKDMSRWLRFQMGMEQSDLYRFAKLTHQRDETVPLHGMSSYAMGWDISLSGTNEISHDGLNPNFTSYISFRGDIKKGIVVLANSNSTFTDVIGERVMKLLANEKIENKFDPGDRNDKVYSLISLILAVYILVILIFLSVIVVDIAKGTRKYTGITLKEIRKAVRLLAIMFPFLYGLYIFPEALANFSWRTITVWSPVSLTALVLFILASFLISYVTYLIGLCFPEKNTFKSTAPQILLISILSGIANMIVIAIITTSLSSEAAISYLMFYYVLTMLVYLLGRRFVQINLIRFTRGIVYELRIKLIDKIFSSSYQKFEKLDRGKVYTVLNDDVNIIGNSTNTIVMLVTSIFTATGAFIYLGSIALWATLLTVVLVLIISVTYFYVSRSTNKYFEKARDTQNDFLRLINGMIDGYKEISMHWNKKQQYKEDVKEAANEYRHKISIANIRFVNAFLVGESSLILLLGLVVFALPKLFIGIKLYTTMSFVLVLLYLIGPVNDILNSIPALMQLKVAFRRIRSFLNEIPERKETDMKVDRAGATVESISIRELQFRYNDEHNQSTFAIGPIDLEVKSGEILFIIGGNGSGKTTLAKLITGLYEPDEGEVLINDKIVESSGLSSYFSAVFSPMYIFEKLYNIDQKQKSDEISKYLKILDLDKKVKVENNRYSTINLSGGQRKRLALLQCYLEDSPIYLFDEWAADQDPDYRFFFYRTLLPEMRKMGKIVIAITHDDHYFDVADRIFKMNQGKLEAYSEGLLFMGMNSKENIGINK